MIKIKQWRLRVFGPGYFLAQFKCLIHSRSFTIYPIGWSPFGRLPIVDLSPSGEVVSEDLERTLFSAVASVKTSRGRKTSLFLYDFSALMRIVQHFPKQRPDSKLFAPAH